MNNIVLNPIIPIWLMGIICVAIIALKRRGVWPYVRQILIAILLFVINMRPIIPGDKLEVQKQEMNTYVLFAVDDTISMLAEDYEGNSTRRDGAYEACAYIVDQLPGAHYSVISFHNSAVQLSPYTDNDEHIKNTIKGMYPIGTYYAHGSNPSIAKDAMITSIKDVSKRGKLNVAVFFISDGEITGGGTLDSFEELAQYIDEGAVLGFGTEKGGKMQYQGIYDDEPSPVTTWDDNYDQVDAISYIDEKNLKQIASDMNVDYIHMPQWSELDRVINEIKKNSGIITSTIEGGEKYAIDAGRDTYFYFVIPLFALFVFEGVSLIKKRMNVSRAS